MKDQHELGRKLTEIITAEDPLWLLGHNIMSFDQLKLRELTGEYFPSANHRPPITTASQEFLRVLSKGRFTIDTYGYMAHYWHIFADNKLSTLEGFQKSLGYEHQARLVRDARKGNKQAFDLLVKYICDDGHHTRSAGKRVMQVIAPEALAFRRDSDSICTGGRKTLGEDYWKRRAFLMKGTFETSRIKQRMKQAQPDLAVVAREHLTKGFIKGYFKHVHVLYLTPFVAACKDILEQTGKQMLDQLRKTHEPLEKFALLEGLNNQLEYLVHETSRILKSDQWLSREVPVSEMQRRALYCLFNYHGLRQTDANVFMERIRTALHNTNTNLKKYDHVNQGTHFQYIHGTPDLHALEESLYGCWLGTGPALSLSPGKIIANPFGAHDLHCFVYDGTASRRDETSHGERRILQHAVEMIFANTPGVKVLHYLEVNLAEFSAGRCSREEYFIPRKRRTYCRALLGDIIARSNLPEKTKIAYEELASHIGNRFSAESRKKLADIIAECTTQHAARFIIELYEEILHPFPNIINLARTQGSHLMPESAVGCIDYKACADRLREHTALICEAIRPPPPQLELFGRPLE